MKIAHFLILIGTVLIFSTCHNDLNINAPYKEIPSIYAVLDPTLDEQIIRINKVFLGEGDANKMAKVADSINYAEGELIVTLERYVDGKKAQASLSRAVLDPNQDIILTERMIETQPGSFSTTQRVYVTSEKLYDVGEYRLTVKNKHTGNVFKSKANALQPVNVGTFLPLREGPYYPYPGNSSNDAYIDYSAMNSKPPFEIRYSINSAYSYQLIIRFHINDSIVGKVVAERLVDYDAGTKTIKDVQKLLGGGINYLAHTFTGSGIYSTLGTEIAKYPKNIIGRRINYMEYIIYSSTMEYLDYSDFTKPSLSLNQNKPLYSNFENSAALGVFTFRTKKSVTKQASTLYLNAIASNPSTCQHLFFDQNLRVSGCK